MNKTKLVITGVVLGMFTLAALYFFWVKVIPIVFLSILFVGGSAINGLLLLCLWYTGGGKMLMSVSMVTAMVSVVTWYLGTAALAVLAVTGTVAGWISLGFLVGLTILSSILIKKVWTLRILNEGK